MSIRNKAIEWLKSNYGEVSGKVYTSKYYLPEESWPKEHVWWLQIPIESIKKNDFKFINFVCQTAPNKNDFHFLKVPNDYLKEHLQQFDLVFDKIHLYLSANTKNLFVETRGKGPTNFSEYLVTKN